MAPPYWPTRNSSGRACSPFAAQPLAVDCAHGLLPGVEGASVTVSPFRNARDILFRNCMNLLLSQGEGVQVDGVGRADLVHGEAVACVQPGVVILELHRDDGLPAAVGEVLEGCQQRQI
ncbi:hypothetical protein GCM10020000_70620 [Streptomyces olivoverticillatus]